MVPAHLKPQPYKTKLTVDKVDVDEQDTLNGACSSDSILSYMKKGAVLFVTSFFQYCIKIFIKIQ